MEKILFVATIDQHIRHFHLPFLRWFKERNYEVHVASNGQEVLPNVDKKFNISLERSPFKYNNIKAYKQLKTIIDQNDYSLIHCHTPMGGAITRIASMKARKRGTKVIYTAHGFHFYRGASLKNWLLYFPIEKLLSAYTDCLITINEEDYGVAKRLFNTKKVELVSGVGLNTNRFKPQTQNSRALARKEYGYKEKELILIYVAELSYRKYQNFLINAMQLLSKEIPYVKLILVGKGPMENEYSKLIKKLNLGHYIELTGYRTDIDKLMMVADIAVSSSRQEGLPVNIMEAMGTGLPLVVTNCRGNRDLVVDGKNGFIVDNEKEFVQKIIEVHNNSELYNKMSKENLSLIQDYSLENILDVMGKIYSREVGRNKL